MKQANETIVKGAEIMGIYSRQYDIEIIITDSKSKKVIRRDTYENMHEITESFDCQQIDDKHMITHVNIDIRK